jgi:hypothetical protein
VALCLIRSFAVRLLNVATNKQANNKSVFIVFILNKSNCVIIVCT